MLIFFSDKDSPWKLQEKSEDLIDNNYNNQSEDDNGEKKVPLSIVWKLICF